MLIQTAGVPAGTFSASRDRDFRRSAQVRQWAEVLAMVLVLTLLYVLSKFLTRLQATVDIRAALAFREIYEPSVWWAWWALHAAILTGLLALGRSRLPCVPIALLTLAAWSALWAVGYGGAPRPVPQWLDSRLRLLVAAGLFLLFVPIVSRIYQRRGWLWLPQRRVSAPWLAPGFVLFSAIGSLLVMDYSAHGGSVALTAPSSHMEGGQLQGASLAMMVVTLLHPFTSSILRMLMRALSWLSSGLLGGTATTQWSVQPGASASRRDRSPHRWALAVLTLVWLLLLLILKQSGSARLTPWVSEAVRLPFLIVLAWGAYRWVELGGAGSAVNAAQQIVGVERRRNLLLLLALLVGLLLLGVAVSREFGQLLLCAVVLVIVTTTCALHLSRRPWPLKVTLALLVAAAVVLGLMVAPPWLAKFTTLGHVADRIGAIDNPFRANVDFLALHRWLLIETGASGFGVGQVPWCGYVATLANTCVVGRGVARQIYLDYAFVGLLAQWGTLGASLLALGLVAWLSSLGRRSAPTETVGAFSPALWRAWLVGVFCLALIVQSFLTMAGSLGYVLLTGVPLPLIAYSRITMVLVAGLLALAVSTVED